MDGISQPNRAKMGMTSRTGRMVKFALMNQNMDSSILPISGFIRMERINVQ